MAVQYATSLKETSASTATSKPTKPCEGETASIPPNASLTPAQAAIVKSTAPLLKEHGETITTLFYRNMISAHPELNNVFNRTSQATGAQPRALAHAVFAYAAHIDDLSALSSAVARMADKHVSLGIQPEQYPIVGKHLIDAVATVLGDAVTPEVAEAWTNAYNMLANILINAEKGLYSSFKGWDGWRKFKIEKKIPESSEITSFYLVPSDGKPLPSYKPGQYVSLRIWVKELGTFQPRQYSLSEDPVKTDGKYYRIGVKKEPGEAAGMPGLISNRLHEDFNVGDEVEITHPCGLFFLDDKAPENSPLVLISAGVGITPMISILNHVTSSSSTRPISWIHGARHPSTQAFSSHVKGIVAKHPNVTSTVFRSHSVDKKEVKGVDYDFISRIDLSKIDAEKKLFLHERNAGYYICGPLDFMHSAEAFLKNAGVDETRIHMEVFNTGGLD
jgi:nitric oxide dioxygenase